MSWDAVPRGKNPPGVVSVVIETPLGSRIKYASSEEHEAMTVSKLLPPAFAFPANMGFLARCWGEDDDPLDAMVVTEVAIAPGTVCSARPIAVMRMTDRGERDDKLFCVLDGDPTWSRARGLAAVPRHLREQFTTFFATYRRAEGTQAAVKLHGWGDLGSARRLIEAGYRRYDQRSSMAVPGSDR